MINKLSKIYILYLEDENIIKECLGILVNSLKFITLIIGYSLRD